jgi:hypothetical protein
MPDADPGAETGRLRRAARRPPAVVPPPDAAHSGGSTGRRRGVFRFLLLAVAAISGGVFIGRRMLDREVERRVQSAVELAQEKASAELDVKIRDLVRERLVTLALTLAVKASLIGAAYWLMAAGHLTHIGFRIVVTSLIFLYIARDVLMTWPYAVPAFRYAREARWSPRKALKTFVVGVVFERAYAEALLATEKGPHRFWLALSNYQHSSFSKEVAQKIAEVAVDTSFARARMLFIISAASAAAMIAAYTAFAWLAILSEARI